MKTLTLFLSLILLISCSSESNNENDDTDNLSFDEMIIGKWIVEYQWSGPPKEYYQDYIGLPETEPENTIPYILLDEVTTFLFRTDGSVFVHEWGEEYTKDYYIEGNDLFLSGFDPEDTWLSWKIYDMTEDYLIARKSCYNNDCDDDDISVRYYRKIE